MRLLQTLERSLYFCEKVLLVAVLSVMVGLAFLQVVLRQGFHTGLLWADVFLRHLVLWAGFLGAAVATAQDKHFIIDAVRKLFHGKAGRAIGLITHLFSAVCLWFIAGAAIRFLKDDRAAASILFTAGGLEVPSWWMNLAIPAGFILLCIHFALRAASDTVELLNKEDAR